MIEDINLESETEFKEFLNTLDIGNNVENSLREIINGYFDNLVANSLGKPMPFFIIMETNSFKILDQFVNKHIQMDHLKFFGDNLHKMDFNSHSALHKFMGFIKELSKAKASAIFKHFLNEWEDPNHQAKLLNMLLDSDLYLFIVHPLSQNELNQPLIKKMLDLESTPYGEKLWNHFNRMTTDSCIPLLTALASTDTDNTDAYFDLLIEVLVETMEKCYFYGSVKAFELLVSRRFNIFMRALNQIFIYYGDSFIPDMVELGERANKEINRGCLYHKNEKFSIYYALFLCLRGNLDLDSWCSKRNINSKKHVTLFLDAIETCIISQFKTDEEQFLFYCERYSLKIVNLYKILQTCQKLNKKANKPKKIQERIANLSKEISICFPEIDLEGGLSIQEYVTHMLEKYYSEKLLIDELLKIIKRYQVHPLDEIKAAFEPLVNEPFILVSNIKTTSLKAVEIEKIKELITRLIQDNLPSNERMNSFLKTLTTYLKSKDNSPAKKFAVEMIKLLRQHLFKWEDFTIKLFSSDYMKNSHLDLLEEIKEVTICLF